MSEMRESEARTAAANVREAIKYTSTCGDCGLAYTTGKEHTCPTTIAADLLTNAKATQPERLTTERGKVYGHPRDHFARTVGILGIVFGTRRFCDMQPRDWAVVMECDKLARFAETFEHADSQADIAGYAETWRMCGDPR